MKMKDELIHCAVWLEGRRGISRYAHLLVSLPYLSYYRTMAGVWFTGQSYSRRFQKIGLAFFRFFYEFWWNLEVGWHSCNFWKKKKIHSTRRWDDAVPSFLRDVSIQHIWRIF